MSLVTIDFHNTLFQCDDWFRLEVENLPVAFLEWRGDLARATDPEQLATSVTVTYRMLRQGVQRSGVECDAETSVLRVMEAVGISIHEDEISEGVYSLMREALDSASPKPGAEQLVQRLHQDGVQIAIVSSAAFHPFLEWCVDRYDLASAIGEIVTSASCGIYKSDPAIYQHTLDLFNVAAEDAIHIGDSHRYDVTSATKVGMKTAFYTQKFENGLDPEPDLFVHDLGEVFPELVRLLGRQTVT
jgi:HAD superfamily hydrolase (TIGR01509 family)